MKTVYIGIGSNLGDREENIKKAVKLLAQHAEVVAQSSLYETEPIGYREQGLFLNGVLCIKTADLPVELLKKLQAIEKILGRRKNFRNAPRIIDLDILYYGCQIVNASNLIIPHPRLHERLFVLVPLHDIAPDFKHPVSGKTTSQLLHEKRGDKDGQVSLFRKN